jgi:hypothetical protein
MKSKLLQPIRRPLPIAETPSKPAPTKAAPEVSTRHLAETVNRNRNKMAGFSTGIMRKFQPVLTDAADHRTCTLGA